MRNLLTRASPSEIPRLRTNAETGRLMRSLLLNAYRVVLKGCAALPSFLNGGFWQGEFWIHGGERQSGTGGSQRQVSVAHPSDLLVRFFQGCGSSRVLEATAGADHIQESPSAWQRHHSTNHHEIAAKQSSRVWHSIPAWGRACMGDMRLRHDAFRQSPDPAKITYPRLGQEDFDSVVALVMKYLPSMRP